MLTNSRRTGKTVLSTVLSWCHIEREKPQQSDYDGGDMSWDPHRVHGAAAEPVHIAFSQ